MTILAFCPNCKTYVSRKKDDCGCGFSLSKAKKFRINVRTPEGQRITKVVEGNLTLARKVEAKTKTEVIEKKHLGIQKAPWLSDVWEKYLKWAKRNKKSWYDDDNRWELHVKPYIGDKKMDEVTRNHVKKIIDRLETKGRAPATVKQVHSLIKRVYNWSIQNDLYHGINPVDRLKPPKVDNAKTACLANGQLEGLLKTINEWKNERAALVVKYALMTGLRLSEVCKLEWSDIDEDKTFMTIPRP